MHRELVLSAFKKARKEVKEETGVTMSITGLSKKISDYMMDECHFQYHEKSLRNKYNIAMKGEEVELKSSVANCLCCYLGYENYAAFIVEKNNQEIATQPAEIIPAETALERAKKEVSMGEKLKIVIQKNKITLIFGWMCFLMNFGLYMTN
ncbi:hypothetical protein [Kordia sp.]|uniref:hypothetical protein n=1 Tax=Kordia sp. TaxID=1965332 RepID=UPI003D6BA90C